MERSPKLKELPSSHVDGLESKWRGKIAFKGSYVLEKMRKFGAQDKVCRETFAFL